MTVDILEVIEAAYAVELSESEWLDCVMAAVRRELEAVLGAGGHFYDVSVRPIRIWGMRAPMLESELQSALTTLDEDYIQKGWLKMRFVATSEVPGFDRQRDLGKHLREYGVEDVVCLNCLDTSGIGVIGIGHRISS